MSKNFPTGTTVSWAKNKTGIKYGGFTAKAKLWLYIIASRVSPSGNVSDVPYARALMIVYILEGI